MASNNGPTIEDIDKAIALKSQSGPTLDDIDKAIALKSSKSGPGVTTSAGAFGRIARPSQEPTQDQSEAFKQGILNGATMNYSTPDKDLIAKESGAFKTGKFIGSIAPTMGMGAGVTAAGRAIPAVSTAIESAYHAPGIAGLLSRMGIAGVQSGAQAAATGAISKPEEGETRLENATTQGLAATVAGPILQAASEVPGAIKGAVKTFADKEAFKALNPFKTKMVQKLVQSGQAPEIGATALETGVVSGIPTTKSGIARRANEAVEQVGEKLGQKIDQIANHVDEMSGIKTGKEVTNPLVSQPKIGVSREAIADHLENELVKDHMGVPTLEDNYSKIQKLIDRFREGGDSVLSIKQAQKAKEAIGKSINWNRLPHEDIPTEEAFNRAMYHSFSSGIEDAADVASQTMGPGSADEYRILKQQYSNLKNAATIANKASVGEYTNRFISPSDYGVGMFSSLLGASPEKAVVHGVVGALANKGARTFGNQILSSGANKASQILGDLQPLMDTFSNFVPQISNMGASNFIDNHPMNDNAMSRRLKLTK